MAFIIFLEQHLLRAIITKKKENSWSKKMYKILDLFQLSSTINSKSFNKKIEDFYKDKLKSELCRIKQNSGKLRFYSKIFDDFEVQRY